jgi:hypothetical protein
LPIFEYVCRFEIEGTEQQISSALRRMAGAEGESDDVAPALDSAVHLSAAAAILRVNPGPRLAAELRPLVVRHRLDLDQLNRIERSTISDRQASA